MVVGRTGRGTAGIAAHGHPPTQNNIQRSQPAPPRAPEREGRGAEGTDGVREREREREKGRRAEDLRSLLGFIFLFLF